MALDDSNYITPHEAALAVVATSMKKARMQLDVLITNTVIAGMLFSSGGILTVAVHSDNPDIWNSNPGSLDFVSGIFYGTGLFWVVVIGADLYNSNILYFSVGFLRRSVSIYDLLVSWFCSLIGNLGGSLLISYVICHLSASSTSPLWKVGSRRLVESKASFSFIQTFLKGIAGNFFVCLAIYLQIMAKPLHVRWFLTVLPIFTFVACGFSHVVADMALSFIGMLNGANVSVGKYIWKLLIPAAVGNILGGFFFSLTIPFYLHLIVVERDNKKLSLPRYEERDEQPELNMDSRVVTISRGEERYDEEQAEEAEQFPEKDPSGHGPDVNAATLASFSPVHSSRSSGSSTSSYSEVPQVFDGASLNVPFSRSRSNCTCSSCRSKKCSKARRYVKSTPAGVFPVKGMASPFTTSRMTDAHLFSDVASTQMPQTHESAPLRSTKSLPMGREDSANERDDFYKVLDQKPGAKLERAIAKLMTRAPSPRPTNELPRTTQDAFPCNQPPSSYGPDGNSAGSLQNFANLFRPDSYIEEGHNSRIPRARPPSLPKTTKSR